LINLLRETVFQKVTHWPAAILDLVNSMIITSPIWLLFSAFHYKYSRLRVKFFICQSTDKILLQASGVSENYESSAFKK
jgi:hypothetical protein